MADFKQAPEPETARETLAIALGLDQVPGGFILVAFWPVILGIILFIGFRIAGKRLIGSACLGALSIIQLWVAGVFG